MRLLFALLAALSLGFAAPSGAQAPPPPPDAAVAPEPTPAPAVSPAVAPTPAPAASNLAPATVFGYDYMQRALVAGVAVGAVCAYLGVFVVLRRVVFVGIALAEFSSAGVAGALLKDGPPMVGSVLGMLVGTGLLSVRWAPRKVRQDAVIGIGYVSAAAAAILILARSPRGESHLLDILSGNIITVTGPETLWTCAALGAVLLFHRLFAKELLFVSFDPDTAQASGYPVRLWDTALTLSVGVAIAFAVHAVGTLVTFGSLVLPAVTALLLAKRMGRALTAATALGIVPVPIGLYLSFALDLSPGAAIVMTGVALLAVAGLVAAVRRS